VHFALGSFGLTGIKKKEKKKKVLLGRLAVVGYRFGFKRGCKGATTGNESREHRATCDTCDVRSRPDHQKPGFGRVSRGFLARCSLGTRQSSGRNNDAGPRSVRAVVPVGIVRGESLFTAAVDRRGIKIKKISAIAFPFKLSF
jgi:hypothetical protein